MNEEVEKLKQELAAARIQNAAHAAGANPAKIPMIVKIIRSDVVHAADGALTVSGVPLDNFVAGFLKENPEFLPPRLTSASAQRDGEEAVDADSIRVGMSQTDQAKAAGQILKHLPGQKLDMTRPGLSDSEKSQAQIAAEILNVMPRP